MIYVIANPLSGHGRGKKAIEKIKKYCLAQNIDVKFLLTERAAHATELAAELSLTDGDKAAIMGGDGTFHEAFNGLKDPSSFPIGLIPTGRGNDFARTLDLPSDPVKAFAAVVKGNTRALDYMTVGDRRCLNVAGTGMDIDVLTLAKGAKNKAAYYFSLVKCLHNFKPAHIAVTLDGKRAEYDCIMAGVCNGRSIGGNIRIAPIALPDDGKLELIVMLKPKGSVFKVLPKFVKGKHMNMPITLHFSVESVDIETPRPVELDGEIYDDLPFSARIVKSGFSVYYDDAK